MTTAIAKLAERFALGNASEATEILKATAFKGPATDAQMTALCVVAQQYGLNPFTRELYAFPDRNNGIVPVVGVDGWARIINEAPQFDGMSFEQDDDKCTCTIYRKDRAHPIAVTEYMTECKRDAQPWRSHPRRMLRHKAMIQCARIAFGFVGIYDQDEAERIVEKPIDGVVVEAKALPPMDAERFTTNINEAWADLVASGKKSPDQIVTAAATRFTLTDEQIQAIRGLATKDEA